MRSRLKIEERTRQGRRLASALVVCLAIIGLASCGLDDPTTPNTPAQLTGQNPTEFPTFSGTITLSNSGGSLPADGLTDFVVNVLVRDGSGNPAQTGTPVSASITIGSVRQNGTDPALASSAAQALTINGQASFAVRSLLPGAATLTVWIADVVRTIPVNFEITPLEAFLSLVIRIGEEDFFNVLSLSPLDVGLAATATNSTGAFLPGVRVRFKIIQDNTTASGLGGAFLGGPADSNTSGSGEAFNTLFVRGAGEVVVIAELIDPNLGIVVAESNQIITTTSEVSSSTVINLTLGTTGTTATGAVPVRQALQAEVLDLRSGLAITGVQVRFVVISDSSSSATLANTELTQTDSKGLATNQVTVTKPGLIRLEAHLVDIITGEVTAKSNEAILNATS